MYNPSGGSKYESSSTTSQRKKRDDDSKSRQRAESPGDDRSSTSRRSHSKRESSSKSDKRRDSDDKSRSDQVRTRSPKRRSTYDGETSSRATRGDAVETASRDSKRTPRKRSTVDDSESRPRAEPEPSSTQALVPNQFPDQTPLDYSVPFQRPPEDSQPASFGAAAEYYGDAGESVHHQPGVRPHTPIVMGTEPHLLAASANPNPPQETGQGAAQEFYTGNNDSFYTAPSNAGSSAQTPSKPSRINYGAAGLTAASAYAVTQVGSSSPRLSASDASPANRPSKPSKQSSSSSNLPYYAAGAAGVAGASAAAWHHHQQHHQSSQHSASYSQTGGPPNPTSYAQQYPSASVHSREQRGPLSKFADWWKDHEDIRKMEEYTEYIGVCKYCFDPQSSPRDAPRRHTPGRKQSREFKDRTRVTKSSRYAASSSSSSSDDEKGGAGWLAAAGLAGYGLTKAAKSSSKSASKRERTFDDYPIMTGDRIDRRTAAGSSKIDTSLERRSSGSYAVGGRDSERDSSRRKQSDRRSSDVFVETDDRVDSRRKSSLGMGTAAAAGAVVGAAALASGSGSRKGSRGVSFSAEVDESGRRAERHESSRNRRGSSVGSDDSEPGFFKSLFSPSSKKKRSRESKGKRPMYGLSNTSVDSKLAYGSGVSLADDKRRSKGKRRSSTEGATEALIGLGAATAALAAAESGRKRGSHSAADVVAVKEPRKALTVNKKEKMHEEAVSSDNGWESASDDDASSSVSSGLAFGGESGLGRRVSARSSSESLSSNASGAGNWDWRWNKKADQRKHSSSRDRLAAAATGVAAAGVTSAVVGASASDSRSKKSSIRPAPVPLQHVEPVPTSDPNVIDAAYRDVSHSYPVAARVSTQTSNVPLQQPKPLSPPKNLPDSIPSEFRDVSEPSKRRRSVTWKDTTEEFTYPRRKVSPPSDPISPNTEDPYPRRRPSEQIASSGIQDVRSDRGERRQSRRESESQDFPVGAALAGTAAATMAAGALYKRQKDDSKDDSEGYTRSSDRTSNRRIDPPPQSYYYPPDLTYQASKPITKPSSEPGRRRPTDPDVSQSTSRRSQYDDMQRQAPETKFVDARDDIGRSQYIAPRTEVREPSRTYVQPDEPPGMSQYSDAQTTIRKPKEDATEAFPSLPKSNREEDDRFDEGIHRYDDKRESTARDVSPRRFTEPKVRLVEDPINSRFETRKASDRRQSEPIFDDDIFDPDFFKRPKRDSVGRRQEEDADRLVKDLEDRYNEGPTDQAAFFSPPDLTPSENVLDSRVDADISNDTRSKSMGSFSDAGSVPNYKPGNIPQLQVIAPTPPESTSGSVRGDRSPSPSPIRKPIQYDEPEETGREAASSSTADDGKPITDDTDAGTTETFSEKSNRDATTVASDQEQTGRPRPRRSFFDIVSGVASGNDAAKSAEQTSAQSTKDLPPDDTTGTMPGQFVDDTAAALSSLAYAKDDTANTRDQGEENEQGSSVSRARDATSDHSSRSNGHKDNNSQSRGSYEDDQTPSQDGSSYAYGEGNETPSRKLSKKQKKKDKRRKASGDDYDESQSTSQVTFDTDGRVPGYDRGEDPAVGTSSLFQAAKVNNTSPTWPLQMADEQILTSMKDDEPLTSSRDVESLPSQETAAVPIPLSDSPPGSPREDNAAESPAPVQTSYRPGSEPSSTAIPFRFRRNPYSPTVNKESPASTTASPVTPPAGTPTRTRQSRPGSTDFRTSGEFRPLYLLEKTRKIPEPVENLPSLPSSRTSSVHESEDDYESANESPKVSTHAEQAPTPLTIQVPRSAEDEHYLDSQQTTPRAGFFGPDISDFLESPGDQNPTDSVHEQAEITGDHDRKIAQAELTGEDETHARSEHQDPNISPAVWTGLGVAGVAGAVAAGTAVSDSKDRSGDIPQASSIRHQDSSVESPTASVFSYQVAEFPKQDEAPSWDAETTTLAGTEVASFRDDDGDNDSQVLSTAASQSQGKSKKSKKAKQKDKRSGPAVEARGWVRPVSNSKSSKNKGRKEPDPSVIETPSTSGQKDIESGEWEENQPSEQAVPQRTTSQVMSTAEALEEGEATGLGRDHEIASNLQTASPVDPRDRSVTPEDVYHDVPEKGTEQSFHIPADAGSRIDEHEAQEKFSHIVSDMKATIQPTLVSTSRDIDQAPLKDNETGPAIDSMDRSLSALRVISVSPSQIALPTDNDEDLNDDQVGNDDFAVTQSGFNDSSPRSLAGLAYDGDLSSTLQEGVQHDFEHNSKTADVQEAVEAPGDESEAERPNEETFDEVPAFLRSRGVVSTSDYDRLQPDNIREGAVGEPGPTDDDNQFTSSRKGKKKNKRKQSQPVESFEEEEVTATQPEASQPDHELSFQGTQENTEIPEFDQWAFSSKKSKKKQKGKSNNDRSFGDSTSVENTGDVTPATVEEPTESRSIESEPVKPVEPDSVPVELQASDNLELDNSYMSTKKSKKLKQKKKKGINVDQDPPEEIQDRFENSAPTTLDDLALSGDAEPVEKSTSLDDTPYSVEQGPTDGLVTSVGETPATEDSSVAEEAAINEPKGSASFDEWGFSTKKSKKKKGKTQTIDPFDEVPPESTTEKDTQALTEDTREVAQEPAIEDEWALPSSSKKKKDKKKKRQSLADFITPTTVTAGAAAAGIAGVMQQASSNEDQETFETDNVDVSHPAEATTSKQTDNSKSEGLQEDIEQAPESTERALNVTSMGPEESSSFDEWALLSKKSKKMKKAKARFDEVPEEPQMEEPEVSRPTIEDKVDSVEDGLGLPPDTSMPGTWDENEQDLAEKDGEDDVGTRRSLRKFVTPAAVETAVAEADTGIRGSMKPPHAEDDAAEELTRIDQAQDDIDPSQTMEVDEVTETSKDIAEGTVDDTDGTAINEPVDAEFKNVFGNLKKTKTENYMAPDVFGNNIRSGKAALRVTGGPQPSVIRDEFKESLISQRAAMRAKAEEQSGQDLRGTTIEAPKAVDSETLIEADEEAIASGEAREPSQSLETAEEGLADPEEPSKRASEEDVEPEAALGQSYPTSDEPPADEEGQPPTPMSSKKSKKSKKAKARANMLEEQEREIEASEQTSLQDEAESRDLELVDDASPQQTLPASIDYPEEAQEKPVDSEGAKSWEEEWAPPISSKKAKKAKKAKARANMLEEQERDIEASEQASLQDETEPNDNSESRGLELVDDLSPQQTTPASVDPLIDAEEAQERPVESQGAASWEDEWALPMSSKKSKKSKKAKARAAMLEEQERSIEASEHTSSQEETRPTEESENRDVELIGDDSAAPRPIQALAEPSSEIAGKAQDKQVESQGSGVWEDEWALPVTSKKDKKKKKQTASALTFAESPAPEEPVAEPQTVKGETPLEITTLPEDDATEAADKDLGPLVEAQTESFQPEAIQDQAEDIRDEWALKPTSKKAKKAAKKAKRASTFDELESAATEPTKPATPEQPISHAKEQALEAEDSAPAMTMEESTKSLEQEDSTAVDQPQDDLDEWALKPTTKKGKKAAKKAKARQGSLADTENMVEAPPDSQVPDIDAEQDIQRTDETGDFYKAQTEDLPVTRDVQETNELQDTTDDYGFTTTSKKAKKAAKKARATQLPLDEPQGSDRELVSEAQGEEPTQDAAAVVQGLSEREDIAPKVFEGEEDDTYEPSQSSKSKKKKAKKAKQEAAAAARRVSFDPGHPEDVEASQDGQGSRQITNYHDSVHEAAVTTEVQRDVSSSEVGPNMAGDDLASPAIEKDNPHEQGADQVYTEPEDHAMLDIHAEVEPEIAPELSSDLGQARDAGSFDHQPNYPDEEPVEEIVASAPLSLRNSKEETEDDKPEQAYDKSEDHTSSMEAAEAPVTGETDDQMESVSGPSSRPTTEPSTRRESTEDTPIVSSSKKSKKDKKKAKKEKSRKPSARDLLSSPATPADNNDEASRHVEDDSMAQEELSLPADVQRALGRYSMSGPDSSMRNATDPEIETFDRSDQPSPTADVSRMMPGTFDEDEQTFESQERDIQDNNQHLHDTQQPEFATDLHDDAVSVPLPEPTVDEDDALASDANQYEEFVTHATVPEQNEERNLDDSTMPTDIVWLSRRDESPQSHIRSPSRGVSVERHHDETTGYDTRDQPLGQERSTRFTGEHSYPAEQIHGQKRSASNDRSTEDNAITADRGFEGASFDPNLVLQDPDFLQRRSPPSAALEPADDDFYPISSGKKKNKKQRKSKAVDISYGDEETPSQSEATHLPTSEDNSKSVEFESAIEAGLTEAGFASTTLSKPRSMEEAQRSSKSPSPTRSWQALTSPAGSTEDLKAQRKLPITSSSASRSVDEPGASQAGTEDLGEDEGNNSFLTSAAGVAAVAVAGAAVAAGTSDHLRRSSSAKSSKKKKSQKNKSSSQAFPWEEDNEARQPEEQFDNERDEEAPEHSRDLQGPAASVSSEDKYIDRVVQEPLKAVAPDLPSRGSSPDYVRQRHYVYDSEPDDDVVDPGPRYSYLRDAPRDLSSSSGAFDTRETDDITMDDEPVIPHVNKDDRTLDGNGGASSPRDQPEDTSGRRRSVAFNDDDHNMSSTEEVPLHERVRPPTPAMLGRSIDELMEDDDISGEVRSIGQQSDVDIQQSQSSPRASFSSQEVPRIAQVIRDSATSPVEEGLSTKHTSIAVDQDLEPQIALEEQLARRLPPDDGQSSRHTSFVESTGSRDSYLDPDVEADQLSGRPLSRNMQSHDLEPIVENPNEDSPTTSRDLFSNKDFDSRFQWPSAQETPDQANAADQSSSRAIDDGETGNKANSSSPLAPELSHLKRTSGRSSSISSKGGEMNRPLSATSARSGGSNRSGTPGLRRRDRSTSGDLRAASKRGEAQARDANDDERNTTSPASDKTLRRIPSYDPLRGSGTGRTRSEMSDAPSFEGWGDARGSPRSPSDSRPPSLRKRQSVQILDLENKLDQIMAENQALREGRSPTARSLGGFDIGSPSESSVSRDPQVRQKDVEVKSMRATLQMLRAEVTRLTERNTQLEATNDNPSEDANGRYAALQVEHENTRQQWESTSRELEELKEQHGQLNTGMEAIVAQEVEAALSEKEAELQSLREELEEATSKIQRLEQQGGSSKDGDTFLNARDEDYFDNACQQLCQHVQQWVLRFSKFSDNRVCRISSEIRDEQIETRLDNAILDGSDVDNFLKDRIRRRDVFMSVVMSMIWEFVFTRYLFGMDRDQRQKLKSLEKLLNEVGPPRAVAQWRAVTLSLLSRREAFHDQRSQDSEAIVQEIYRTLAKILPPPSEKATQIQDSLRNVMRLAVDLSIEMRTQRAEYIMLPPLQPEYDTNGDLARKVFFNASLMNERSGETTSNDELERQSAVVRMVLFPLVVKKGNDFGDSEEEVVVCPAQVLVAKPQRDKKVVRVLSTAMSMNNQPRSDPSVTSGAVQDVNMEDFV